MNTSPLTEFELTTLVVIGTDYTSSCTPIYHTITTTTIRVTHDLEYTVILKEIIKLKNIYQYICRIPQEGMKCNPISLMLISESMNDCC